MSTCGGDECGVRTLRQGWRGRYLGAEGLVVAWEGGGGGEGEEEREKEQMADGRWQMGR